MYENFTCNILERLSCQTTSKVILLCTGKAQLFADLFAYLRIEVSVS